LTSLSFKHERAFEVRRAEREPPVIDDPDLGCTYTQSLVLPERARIVVGRKRP
jgi:hypothetical protein